MHYGTEKNKERNKFEDDVVKKKDIVTILWMKLSEAV